MGLLLLLFPRRVILNLSEVKRKMATRARHHLHLCHHQDHSLFIHSLVLYYRRVGEVVVIVEVISIHLTTTTTTTTSTTTSTTIATSPAVAAVAAVAAVTSGFAQINASYFANEYGG